MVSSASVAALGLGALFGYSAVTGKSPLQAFYLAVRGDDPRTAGTTQTVPVQTSIAGSAGESGNGSGVVASVTAQLGKPYIWDSPLNPATKNPRGFDCSGLAQWSWYQNGVKLPDHNAASQRHYIRGKWGLRPLAQAEPGDLVFYGSDAAPHHVAVYVGGGQIIEAPDVGIPVRKRSATAASDVLKTVGIFPGSTAPGTAGAAGKGGSPAANKALAQSMLSSYGWGQNQFTYLDKLWSQESSWSNTAKNPSSGAYGIAQALPPTKYPKAGQESGGSDPHAQIKWGLDYIKSRYGSPQAAWAHETANNWY